MPDRRSGRDQSVQPMLIALAVSLLFHYVITSSWHGAGTVRQAQETLTLQARLDLDGVPAVDPPLATPQDAAAPVVARAEPQSEGVNRRAPVAPGSRPVTLQKGVGPADGSGDRFYLARELDRYPLPLTPLRLQNHGSGNAGSIRLWASIDQNGRVLEASVADAGLPGMFERSALDIVLAAQFDPARKDGRPVKSRLLLSLNYGP